MEYVKKYNPISLVATLGYESGKRLKLSREEAYRRAKLLGEVNVVYCRVMLLGPGGVGKTSLKRGLMGLEYDSQTNSTIVAEVHSLKSVEVTRDSGDPSLEDPLEREWVTPAASANEWKEVTKEDEIEELARLLAFVTEVKDGKKDGGKSTPLKLSEDLHVSQEYCETIKLLMDSEILNEAFKRAKAMKLDNMPLPKASPFFHMWDCGGQPVFQEVLPVFLTARTMFLLLFNAYKDLHSPIESLHYRFGKEIHQGYVNMTTLQLMEGWMSNIHSYLLEEDRSGKFREYPRVIPIGTRGDQLRTEESKQKVLDDLKPSYDKVFCTVLEKPFIIDNTKAGKGEEEDPAYQVLREKISSFATEQLVKPTPITWVLYRKVLQLISNNFKEKKIISFDEATAAGVLCKVRPEDVHAVLKFYHELGVLLHYPEIKGLKNKIILDPKWFVECLGMVLTLPGIGKEETKLKVEWELLRNKGILVQPLYAAVWGECEGMDPSDLIDLLAMFQLAVEVKTNEYHRRTVKQYFVPAVLAYFTADNQLCDDESLHTTAPLHITFKSGYVTPGFFTRFITTIAKHPDCNLYFAEGIYHNRVMYRFGKAGANLVTFTEVSNVIAVHVRRLGPEMPKALQKDCLELMELCEICCQSVEECLQPDREEHSSKIPRFILVVCQNDKCRSAGAGVHYLEPVSLNEQNIYCTHDTSTYRRITQTEAYWFKDAEITKPGIGSVSSYDSDTNVPVDKPCSIDVFRLLESKATQWDTIGRGFKVPLGFREDLRQEGVMSDSSSKLERVIDKWVESECSEVSWSALIEMLRNLELVEVARSIKRYLMTDPEAVRKYNWQDSSLSQEQQPLQIQPSSSSSEDEFFDAEEPVN